VFRTEYTLAETDTVAQKILDLTQNGSKVIGFKGALGAGKTTLIQAMGRLSGVNVPITSPTFALINEYPCTEGFIYHFDLYRLQSMDEVFAFGFLDYLESGYSCWIEWYEIAESILPPDFWRIEIEHVSEGRRRITANQYV
jgi:tRNA threonylcarbamoyladenosine biosynthesis protein TsaE